MTLPRSKVHDALEDGENPAPTGLQYHMARRFSPGARRVFALARTAPDFRTLYRDFEEASERLAELEGMPSGYVRVEIELVRRRHAAIADKIMSLADEDLRRAGSTE